MFRFKLNVLLNNKYLFTKYDILKLINEIVKTWVRLLLVMFDCVTLQMIHDML